MGYDPIFKSHKVPESSFYQNSAAFLYKPKTVYNSHSEQILLYKPYTYTTNNVIAIVEVMVEIGILI